MTRRLLRLFVPVTLIASLTAASLLAAQSSETYAQAESLVRQGQWEQGITLLQQIIQAEPANLKALNLLGIALTGKNELKDANAAFQRVLKIDPHFYPALKNLAINEFTLKDLTAAQNHLTEALKFAPDDPVIHAYLGNIAYARNDFRTAAGHLEKAGRMLNDPAIAAQLVTSNLAIGEQQKALKTLTGLDRSKLDLRQQFGLGLILAQHELYEQAIPYFQAVRDAHPESNDVAFNLALCYLGTKQYGSAIELLQNAVAHGLANAETYNLLAEAYEGNQQTQEAINALRKATQLAPTDESNYVDLATLCTTYESYEVALEVVEVGLHYLPQSDRLIFQRGVIHAMQSKSDLAEQDFQLASKLAPEKNLSYVAMGVNYIQMGDLAKAIASLRRRIRQKPNDATLHYLLGEALIRSGAAPGNAAFTEAKLALSKSVKLNPKFPNSQVDLAKLYLKENRLDDAIEHLERARALDPKDKAAYSLLAIAYRKKGKSEMATAMLATLNKLNDEDRKGERRLRLTMAGADSPPSDKTQTPSPNQ